LTGEKIPVADYAKHDKPGQSWMIRQAVKRLASPIASFSKLMDEIKKLSGISFGYQLKTGQHRLSRSCEPYRTMNGLTDHLSTSFTTGIPLTKQDNRSYYSLMPKTSQKLTNRKTC